MGGMGGPYAFSHFPPGHGIPTPHGQILSVSTKHKSVRVESNQDYKYYNFKSSRRKALKVPNVENKFQDYFQVVRLFY